MPGFEKTSEQGSATTIAAGDEFLGVQGSATVLYTGTQVATFVAGTGIANTVAITGEFLFTEDNELDYSASFTDGMSAAAITFTELPADTVSINAYVRMRDSGTNPSLAWKRSSGGTQQFFIGALFADGGNNIIDGTYWLPTNNNTIYATAVAADNARSFVIIGYKTGA